MLGGGELAAALGGRFMVLIDDTYSNLFTGEPTRPSRLDDDGWKRLIDTTHRAADLAATRLGLRLVYHPHAETHVEYEDQIEAFLEQTDPPRVALCLDTGHHAYRGGDPVAFFRRHSRPHPLPAPEERRPRRSRHGSSASDPFAIAVANDMFCEPDRGAVDFVAFRDALGEADYDGWATVEQDMYPAPFDKPLPIAKRTARICDRSAWVEREHHERADRAPGLDAGPDWESVSTPASRVRYRVLTFACASPW